MARNGYVKTVSDLFLFHFVFEVFVKNTFLNCLDAFLLCLIYI